MNKASRTPGLFQRLIARPAPVDLDAADMGTAFGLEISLDQPALPPLAPPAARAPGWMQRLSGRAKTP